MKSAPVLLPIFSMNSIARDMVAKYGMTENLGNFVLGQQEVFLGRDYAHTRIP